MESSSARRDEKKPHRALSRTNKDHANTAQLKENEIEKSGNDEFTLPHHLQNRLHMLFRQIEEEFTDMYAENLELRKTIDNLNNKLSKLDTSTNCDKIDPSAVSGVEQLLSSKSSMKGKSSGPLSQKLKTRYKSGTSKLVSSFKPTSTVVCRVHQEFHGHLDGVWDIDCSCLDNSIIGSASADQTAKLWNKASGACIATYVGHAGSVNCIRFHPDKYLALSVSGDASAHLWTYDAALKISSDDEMYKDDNEARDSVMYKNPLVRTTCHTSPVVCCDWLAGGEQFVTAGWDRTACIIDTTTLQTIQTLTGHDLPLTYVSAHRKDKLVVTSSRDSTFRVCDFRIPEVHTVTVGQGHSQSVTSALFTTDDKVVSSSDDRYVKVWDLKSMRIPIASVHFDSPINRISVSKKGIIAIPHDNRQIRLYDTNGNRLARLPRNDRANHRRVVTAAAWIENNASLGLVTCGWDKLLLSWNIQMPSN